MPVSAPNLSDSRLFDRRPGVPILDTHVRAGRDVDEARLRLVAKNSNARAVQGELGLLLIGHTTDDGKEIDQPPLVGYVCNYQMSTWQGKPCILADLYYRKDKPEAFAYPRRSVEVIYSDRDPAHNYIDAVALLVRRPERGLGLMTYRSRDCQLERYSMDSSSSAASVTEADIPALVEIMTKALRDFFRAKSPSTTSADPGPLTAADLPKMDKYFKQNGIDPTKPGAYENGLQRYLASRKDGTLYRT